ncbi:MAG: dockerin type I domain-containing protein [Chloroflexi bacterium]|nr:dockerin type I domain-containing protein [Chloroflexota bacterium]
MRRNWRILLVALALAALSSGGEGVQSASPEFRGGGGNVSSSSDPSFLARSRAVAQLRWLPSADSDSQHWLPNASALGSLWRTPSYQLHLDITLVSDGQFVWGPNVGDFNIEAFLADRRSPLVEYAADIELWASYSSVNPKVLIAILELRQGWVSGISYSIPEEEIRTTIEDTAMSLASTFYEHLHTWGALRPAFTPVPAFGPSVLLHDGSAASLDPSQSSGTVALMAAMAADIAPEGYESKFAGMTRDFRAIFGAMFPESDPLDTSNEIVPQNTPPDNLFQLPFPLGAEWVASGPHSWNGGSWPPPFSSIDFFTGGGSCAAPPNQYAVAAGYGTVNRPSGYRCWLEIDHGGGWVTSYYHLQNLYSGAPLNRGGKVGTIACETCAGGFSTGPHVHFTLKYNGAYTSLEGVKFSGWTVHVGSVPYNSGSFEREGTALPAYSRIVNDYQTYYSNGQTSLRFYGYGADDVDRLKIRLNDLSSGAPADVGQGDFTIEWWMKALPGENDTPFAICSASDAWRTGNVILDRDRAGQGRDYGASLAGGALVFGVRGEAGGQLNLCGSEAMNDGEWHHVALQRRASDGWLWMYVDGVLQTQGDGPDGDISYPNGADPLDLCGGPCINDAFLVVGAEKHGIDPSLRSFSGWIDEMRISDMLRYSVDFIVPSQPFSTDPSTVALYHFDDSPANFAYDTSGNEGGPSNASRRIGGSPAGPEWSTDTPFGPPPTPTPTLDPSITPTVTETPAPSDTPTPTATSVPPTPSHTSSPSPEPTLPSPSPSPLPTETPAPTNTPTPTATSVPPTPAPSVTPGGPSPTPQPADLNLDGRIDVLDVQLCVNVFLGTETDPGFVARADVNSDGSVDVLDVQMVVNAFLGG